MCVVSSDRQQCNYVIDDGSFAMRTYTCIYTHQLFKVEVDIVYLLIRALGTEYSCDVISTCIVICCEVSEGVMSVGVQALCPL